MPPTVMGVADPPVRVVRQLRRGTHPPHIRRGIGAGRVVLSSSRPGRVRFVADR
ncbi:hypothetical protein [Nocardia sp. GAS34]|uniref:hypothetical protein n=1 Tax=Nocardia sp. GAS34 TaxID=3156305 RepID=UPI003D1B24CE